MFCYFVFEFVYKNEIDVVIFKFNKYVFNVFFIKMKYYNIKKLSLKDCLIWWKKESILFIFSV